MSVRLALLLFLAAAATVACSRGPDVEWMKAGPYTSAEFDGDVKACTRQGTLDPACMQERGWFTVGEGGPVENASDKERQRRQELYRAPRPQ